MAIATKTVEEQTGAEPESIPTPPGGGSWTWDSVAKVWNPTDTTPSTEEQE